MVPVLLLYLVPLGFADTQVFTGNISEVCAYPNFHWKVLVKRMVSKTLPAGTQRIQRTLSVKLTVLCIRKMCGLHGGVKVF